MIKLLLRKSLFVSMLKAIGAISLLFFGILISRNFGEEIFGIYSLSFVFVSFSVILNKLGLDLYVLRKVVEYLNDKLLSAFLSKVSKIVIIISAVNFTILFLFEDFWLSTVFQSELNPKLFGILIMAIILISMNNIILELIRGIYGIYLYSLFKFTVLPIIVLFLFVIFIYIFKIPIDPVSLYFLTAIFLGVAFIIWFAYFLFKIKKNWTDSRGAYTRPILIYSAPMMMISSMIFIMGYIDTFMINYFLDIEQVGYYSAVVRLSAAISFVTSSVVTVVASEIARHHLDKKGLHKHFSQTVKSILIVSIPLFLLIVLFSKEILSIYGPNFAQYNEAFIIYSYAVFLGCMPMGHYYVMTDRQVQFQYIIFAGVILNIVLNIILIPTVGIKGAAIATLISYSAWNLVAYINLKKKGVI